METTRNFFTLLKALWAQNKFVCIGLDVDLAKLPPSITGKAGTIFQAMRAFNEAIIDATKDTVCAYKPNAAFYEQYGDEGMKLLRRTIAHINTVAPNVPVILDFKRGDIDNTNNGSVALAKYLGADAVTIAPYMGALANKPFLDEKNMGIFVLGKTSNKGAEEIQDLFLVNGRRVYEQVIENVLTKWNMNGNCGVVIGATTPLELSSRRFYYPEATFLIPGIGAQGGDLEATLQAGFSPKGDGIIINSSRGIIYASSGADFAEVARNEALKLHNAIVAFKEKNFLKALAEGPGL